MKRATLRLVGSLLIAAALWAGLRSYSLHHAAARTDSVRVPAGEASPPRPSDLIDPGVRNIPEKLPTFTLGDRAGKPTSITRWAGKSLVLNFWATWCAPCREEIPLLSALHHEWGDKGVEVIGIAVDDRDQVGAFADQYKIRYPLLIGEQDALDLIAALGVQNPGFPFTVFTDRRGDIVTLFLGALHRPEATLILSTVVDLDQGKITLKAAQSTINGGLRALAANRPK